MLKSAKYAYRVALIIDITNGIATWYLSTEIKISHNATTMVRRLRKVSVAALEAE